MRFNLKKYISLVLSIFFLFSIFGVNITYAENKKIVIYHTNDSHGYLLGDGEKIVGISLAAALKNSTPDSILVDAGDATQGLPIASLTQGADVIDLMNIAGYDVMALGNHEFDFGVEKLLENVKKANFPILSANVYKNGELLLKNQQENNNGCHIVIEKNNFRIGFFGITTTQTKTATNPEGIKYVAFYDEIETAKKEIDELEAENVDIIIAVSHIGNGDADCTSIDLANAMTGDYQGKLDAIIDGHSHTIENNTQNDVLIVQTGYGMSSIGELTINILDDKVTLSDKLLNPKDLKEIEPDSSVVKKLDDIISSQQEVLKEKIAVSENTLWAGWIGDICPVRLAETNFGDFVADAFKNSASNFIEKRNLKIPVVAVQNGGGIRESIPNGEITKEALISAFPFSNTLYMKEVTPKILYDIMEVSGSNFDGQNAQNGMLLQNKISGGFLQISGFSVHFNPNASNNKVVSITLDGQNKPLEKDDTYTKIMLVSNNYIMSGGNDYTMLSNLPKYAEIGGELETIQSYLQNSLQNGLLKGYENTKKRIIISDEYSSNNYIAFIKVCNENGDLIPNQALSYRIDGGKRQNAVTDENSFISINVSDGPHGVRLADSQSEVYIDNYSGIGLIEDNIRKFPIITYLSDGSCDAISETTSESTSETEYYKKSSSGGTIKRNSNDSAVTENNQHLIESTSEISSENLIETTTYNYQKITESLNNKEENIDKNKRVVSITLGSKNIKINNRFFDIDCASYISNNSIMIPLRVVYIALYNGDLKNADENSFILWNKDSKTATIFAGQSVIKFTEGSEFVITDRNSFTMDNMTKAEIKNGRMFVPFSALGKALGVDVDWIDESKTVVFTNTIQ